MDRREAGARHVGILAVVRQPQPLSSWGWDAIEKVKASMGASFGPELEKLARNAAAAANDRVRALLEMQRHGGSPNAALLQALIKDRNADVRSRRVCRRTAERQRQGGCRVGLKDANALVQRRAAEALVRQGLTRLGPASRRWRISTPSSGAAIASCATRVAWRSSTRRATSGARW